MPEVDDLTPEQSIAEIDRAFAVEGWQRIGAYCSVGRRSTWMRLTYAPLLLDEEAKARRRAAGLPEEGHLIDDPTTVTSIEVRTGREGDDFRATFDRSNPQFAELLSLFTLMRFAVET